jgi:hypothetical protein
VSAAYNIADINTLQARGCTAVCHGSAVSGLGSNCQYHRLHLRVFLARRIRVARTLVSTPRMVLKLLIDGRLGRQAAGHPWSALRVVKSCRKDCPTASVLLKPKQQLCIQNGTRAYYLNYLQKEEGAAGKRSAGNRIGQPIRSIGK